MFEFVFGEVGSGKSLAQAKDVLWALGQSVRIQKKYGENSQYQKKTGTFLPIRHVWCNFHLSEKITKKYEDRLHYWKIPQEMIFEDYPNKTILRKNFDCFWDEMAVELPSDKWKDTDPAIRAFFAQHRKRGIRVFGNTQDYMMLDVNARRIATRVFKTVKVIGNRDPSSTLPPIKRVWGLIWRWELDKVSIRADDQDQKRKSWWPEWIWITKRLTSAYDTAEDIRKAEKNRMLHLKFYCDHPECALPDGSPKVVKIEHIKI